VRLGYNLYKVNNEIASVYGCCTSQSQWFALAGGLLGRPRIPTTSQERVMVNSIPALKTNEALLKKLSSAAARQLTSGEIFEQRVSFVFGSIDSKSGITRERVRQVIREQEGGAEGAK
jgi:hypothetical protein